MKETLELMKNAAFTLLKSGKEKEAEAVFVAISALTPAEWSDEDEQEPYQKADHGFWSVAPFLVDRSYGGPEEGGWWYDYGQPDNPDRDNPALKTKYFESKEAAYEWRATMDEALEKYNEGRRPISSVLSEGQYRACVSNGPPAVWPSCQPHYC